MANYYELTHRFDQAIDKLNIILATMPSWIPALVEKMKVVVSVEWDEVQDVANRLVNITHYFKI